MLLFIYCCYLAFQLHTHNDLFAPDGDGNDEPTLTLAASVTALAVITACVAACSECAAGGLGCAWLRFWRATPTLFAVPSVCVAAGAHTMGMTQLGLPLRESANPVHPPPNNTQVFDRRH